MNDVNDERNNTSDTGRLAILVSELQRDVMEMGKHMGVIMQRLQQVDQGAGQRIARLENMVLQPQPAAPAAVAEKQEGPKVIDLRQSQEKSKEPA